MSTSECGSLVNCYGCMEPDSPRLGCIFLSKQERQERAVENQHREIKGYRELNREEITIMNNIKALGAPIGDVVAYLETREDLDQRWVAIGKTHLQQGLMALTRGVAKPDFF